MGTCLFTRSPAHPLTRSPAHPLTRSPPHPGTLAPWHPLTLASSSLLFQLSVVILVSLLVFAAVQAVLVVGFVRVLRSEPADCVAAEDCPKVAVVLCLRGGDPFLPQCIQAILNQDYARYDLHIVIDHVDDPARRIVDESIAEHDGDNVFIQFLTDRLDTCSLKCSSLVQVARGLDASYDIMAQLDADTVAHSSWLSELVAPLSAEDVAATTGNRWYMPNEVSWGSMVRWLWNSAAVVQMFCYRIPWGGTLAIKLEIVRNTDLLERWSRAFCEDTMLAGFLKKRGLRVVFVPSLLMVNRESCGLTDFSSWVSRQLLTARLYHTSWPLVAGHAVLSSGLMVAGIALLVAAAAAGQTESMIVTGAGLVIFQASNFALLWQLEVAAMRAVGRRGETRDRYTWSDLIRMPVAVALTQYVYAVALTRALLTRSVSWRGAIYEISRSKQIRLVHDEPYVAHGDGTTSL